jgi:hypothetical protein
MAKKKTAKKKPAKSKRRLLKGMTENDSRRCTGTVKNGEYAGERCIQWAEQGRKFCRFHGGRSGRPIKHGLYSKFLTADIAEKIEKYLEDPQIKDLRNEIATIRALMETHLESIKSSAEFRKRTTKILQVADGIGKLVEKLVKIEDGLKLRIGVEELQPVVAQIVNIINKRVEDGDVKNRIAKDIRNIKLFE